MAKETKVVTQEDLDSNPELVADGVKVGDEIQVKKEVKENPMMALLRGISDGVQTLGQRMDTVEGDLANIKTGGRDSFKKDIKSADVEKASETRKGIDPKLCQVVDEILGTDFGIELYPLGDRPGFFLNLIVPHRLNDNSVDMRPLRDATTGEYVMNPNGTVKMEEYKLPDKRGKVLSTADSYDAVRQHCERVRAYMVAYYQRANRPMPDLKVA